MNGPRTKGGGAAGERDPTRQEACAERLAERARRLGPGAQLPQFRQLRTELEVSGTTLIAALDALEARGILVRRHGVGIFVARDVHHRNVALLTAPRLFYRDENASPFWQQFVRRAWLRAATSGMHFALHFVDADEHDEATDADGAPVSLGDILAADLRQGVIHGVLGVGLPACAVQWLTRRGIPLVAFAGYAPYAVMTDEALGVQLAVKTLFDRGARRIALWTTSERDGTVRTAYRQALEMRGLADDPSLVNGGREADTIVSSLREGERIARDVFGPGRDPRNRPDAVYCAEDTLTRGALPWLFRTGIRIGVDLPFATHANTGSPLLFGWEDYLIRIENDPARVIEEMFRLLTAQMDGRTPSEERVILPPTVRIPPPTA
ncbi:MAG: GntR family transcriptional regulator [Capsulimonadales bacterium]|nr:GntR family transcriptional regulator [Capsulimonadales bacterium]